MDIQEQAFRAYYASMTDSDLLAVAASKSSFLALAQQILSEEMARRNLAQLPQPVPEKPAGGAPRKWFHKRFRL
jgi:hypothetical protein